MFILFFFQVTFSDQVYYKEAVELIKGYKPMIDRLGEPVAIRKIDVSDGFNYQDLEKAKVSLFFNR